MTREEAIKFGKRVLSLSLFDETHEFCELAVKALEQESCEDAISRKAALDMATSYPVDGWDTYTPLVVDVEDIEELPSVTPQPKMGHWIRMKAYEKWGCSECYTVFRFTFKEHDYCPNCGARMEVEE